MHPAGTGASRAVATVSWRAVLWGLVGQGLYLSVLFLVPSAPSLQAASPTLQATSPLLIVASGAVGGQMAGHVAHEHGASPTRSAAAATALGGAGLAAFVWWFLVTPAAFGGVFWSFAYALATHPAVPVGLVPPGLGVAVLCLGVATARLPLRWDGSAVGRRD